MSKHENGTCGCKSNTNEKSSSCGCQDHTTSKSSGCNSDSCRCGTSDDEIESITESELNSCESGDCNCSAKKNGYAIELALFDSEPVTCPILALFDINDQAYIALNHPESNRQLLYRYYEHSESVSLDVIYDDELDLVAKTFVAIMS